MFLMSLYTDPARGIPVESWRRCGCLVRLALFAGVGARVWLVFGGGDQNGDYITPLNSLSDQRQ